MTPRKLQDEDDVRQRIDKLAAAIRDTDLDRVMACYTPDVVSFDVEAPLAHVGAAAKRRNWERVFAAYRSPLGYQIRNLSITVGDDVAFAHSLNRLAGTLTNGVATDGFWVRATVCLRKIDDDWLIVHDQASVPLDLETGSASLHLEP
ncbi:YybH family protein [Mycobacterium sp. URHB0021]|jgi:ketosteroid isomerase-like protein